MNYKEQLHPNTEKETGNFFLSILTPRAWTPILTLNNILFSLELNIYDPTTIEEVTSDMQTEFPETVSIFIIPRNPTH